MQNASWKVRLEMSSTSVVEILRWVSAFLELIPVSCNKKPYLAACEQLGNGMFFVLLYKAMSEKQNWMNTARAMK